MQNLIFQNDHEIRFSKILHFIIPTYLTSLFNTVYTIIDGIFVASFVSSNALASINIVYPIVNILTAIALLFATGGSSLTAMHIGGKRYKKANQTFIASIIASMTLGIGIALMIILFLKKLLLLLGATSQTQNDCKIYALFWLLGTPVVIGKELLTYFIRVDGSPTYSLISALTGGIINIILDYIFIKNMHLGITGAALATIIGLMTSFTMGIIYFIKYHHYLSLHFEEISMHTIVRCMTNGLSEFVDQLAIAITTIVFNRTILTFAQEDGVAALSIIMYLQFIFIGIYFGFSMGLATPLSYAYGDHKLKICEHLEHYAHCFFLIAPIVIYGLCFSLAPIGVRCFVNQATPAYTLGVKGMRIYGLGFLFSGINIFSAIRLMAYGKGHLAGLLTCLRSFALLLFFLMLLPRLFGINGIWLAVPVTEFLTMFVALFLTKYTSLQKS